jgi:DNA replication protein DnaD
MRQIMLATTLESEYGFMMTPAEMEQLVSVASIRSVLAAHGIVDA